MVMELVIVGVMKVVMMIVMMMMLVVQMLLMVISGLVTVGMVTIGSTGGAYNGDGSDYQCYTCVSGTEKSLNVY